MYVVATAGHVDHGKSTLVKALTGQEPDRLAEEQRRGLTIELGFCWTPLPGVGDVAFVDVPGHGKFLTTALAGLAAAPVVMLVVAADDGWMPQTFEHLHALDALRVRHGVVVVTRTDLADPGPCVEQSRRALAMTSLRDAPIVTASGLAEGGVHRLRDALAEQLLSVQRPGPNHPTRLWVDRRFQVRGAGTIVTGTLPAGSMRVGDALVSKTGGRVRVRSMQSMRISLDSAHGPARLALNIAGDLEGVEPGAALCSPESYTWSRAIDVTLDVDQVAPPLPRQPVLHVGTAAMSARVRPFDAAHARLRTDEDLPWHVGDRGLLRDPGRRRVWGFTVVDPAPPALSRRGDGARRLEALRADDGTAAHRLARGPARRSDLRRLGVPLSTVRPHTLEVGDWLLDPLVVASLRESLATAIAEADSSGITFQAAARELATTPAVIRALITPPLVVRSGRIQAEDLPEGLQVVLQRFHDFMEFRPLQAPTAAEAAELGLDSAAAMSLQQAGAVIRLEEGQVLPTAAVAHALTCLESLTPRFTVSDARRAWKTSRRVALPLLLHLDRLELTERLADDTRRLSSDRAG